MITYKRHTDTQLTGNSSYSNYNTAEIERVRVQIKIIDGLTKYQGIDALQLSEESRRKIYNWKHCMSPLGIYVYMYLFEK